MKKKSTLKNIEHSLASILLLAMLLITSCDRVATQSNTGNPNQVPLFDDREVDWTSQELFHAFQTASSRMTDGFLPQDLSIDLDPLLLLSNPQSARSFYETKVDELFSSPFYQEKMLNYFKRLLFVDHNETDFLKLRRVHLAMYILNDCLLYTSDAADE